jgi:uncharacterized membrane protein (UPF0127 family)
VRAAARPLVIILVLALAAAAALAQATSRLVIEGERGRHTFAVEVAATDETRQVGLMFRKTLAADAGMLFDYQTPQPVAMWMKNTLIPLDMLFIGADHRISGIAERTVPHSLATIDSGGPVRAVLELNAGTAARLGIKVGDLVRHAAFKNLAP